MLQGFLHNVYTGRRSGSRTTGSAVRGGYASAPGVGVRALDVAARARAPEAVMASVPEAFYVQSVSGLHSGTNPISGDFSVGAVGLMVRDGAFAEPVREVTIASTLQRMLLDVTEIGFGPDLPARCRRGRDDAGRRDDAERRLTKRRVSAGKDTHGTHTRPVGDAASKRPVTAEADRRVRRTRQHGHGAVSVAHMRSPAGWSEPRADAGVRRVHGRPDRVDARPITPTASSKCRAGQAVVASAGERVQYSTPEGAEYIAVCLPAFSPDTVHRDDD